MADVREYKCPNCQAAIKYDPKAQTLKCEYCGTEINPDAMTQMQKEKQEAAEKEGFVAQQWETESSSTWGKEGENLRLFVCKSCGGEVICDENTGATSCPYCGSPVVMGGQFSGDLKPSAVIPFAVTKEEAKQKLREYTAKRRMLPKEFAGGAHLDEIKGVYVPVWLFDAGVGAHMVYSAKKTRTYSDDDYDYKETRHYSITRAGNLKVAHVPVDASSKVDSTMVEAIEPFDYSGVKSFDASYLAGFMADRYDIPVEETEGRANERIRASIKQRMRDSVTGYEDVKETSEHVNISNGKSEYALYPLWLLNTSWQGKNYPFGMNGQTGRFVGNMPVDKGAFWLYLFGWFFGVAAVVYGLWWAFTAKSGGPGGMGLAVSLIVGLIAGAIIANVIKSGLHNVNAKTTAADYEVAGSLKFTTKTDTYLYTTTEKTRKAKSGSSNS